MLFLLLACKYLDPEKAGIYGCDEYCDQLVSRTDECATESGKDLDAFVSQVNPDWEGLTQAEIVEECNIRIEENGKSESSCKAETGTFNNLSCDDIVGLWEGM